MNEYTWPERPRNTAYPIASAGYSFIFSSAFTTVVFALLGLTILALLGLVVTVFICYFFRDPDRLVSRKEGVVVSPADGKIISAGFVENSRFLDGSCVKISIFMSVFNVHVNRIPHEGEIKEIDYYPGKFFSANLDKASDKNEHNAVVIETDGGEKICMVQIAGLIARRIICNVQKSEKVVRGQRFGMICFGSRVDVYLPENLNLNVTVGECVKAGSSVLGFLK
jgi:phosphatidylserine decarboxylase